MGFLVGSLDGLSVGGGVVGDAEGCGGRGEESIWVNIKMFASRLIRKSASNSRVEWSLGGEMGAVLADPRGMVHPSAPWMWLAQRSVWVRPLAKA